MSLPKHRPRSAAILNWFTFTWPQSTSNVIKSSLCSFRHNTVGKYRIAKQMKYNNRFPAIRGTQLMRLRVATEKQCFVNRAGSRVQQQIA